MLVPLIVSNNFLTVELVSAARQDGRSESNKCSVETAAKQTLTTLLSRAITVKGTT
jgi:hypothetical protein